MENKPSGGRFIAALLFFATTAGIAILLLLTALVIWLSSVTGSFIAAALIAGGFFAERRPRTPRLPVRDPRRRGTDPQAGRNGLRGGPCSANGLRMARRKGFSVSEAPRGVAEKMKKAGAACCSGFFRPSAKGCAAISARTFAERAFRTCSELRFRFQRFVFRPNVIRPGRKIQTYSRSGRTCQGKKAL